MVLTLRWSLGLFLAAGMMACSGVGRVSDGQMQSPTITLASPLDGTEFAEMDLISFDVYPDGDILHALVATASDTKKHPFIGYLRSDDGGRHWTKPFPVREIDSATVESALGNDIQIAGQGSRLMAVWQVTGEIPGMGPLQVLYSEDGGKTWVVGTNPTQSDVDQSHPELIVDAAGRFHMVWLDDRDENGYQGIRYARSNDLGWHWDIAQTLDDSSCSCCWNRLLSRGNTELYALYRDMEPRDMTLSKSEDAGETWQKASTVGEFNWIFDGCPHNGGALTKGNRDAFHALVWTGAENKAGLYYLGSNDNGKTWTLPKKMGGQGLAFHSDIAAGDKNHVLAIWDERGSEGSAVMISRSFDSGNSWQAAQQVSDPASSATFPRVFATDSGYLAMWSQQKPGGKRRWLSAVIE